MVESSQEYSLAVLDGKLVEAQDLHVDKFQSRGRVEYGGDLSVAGTMHVGGVANIKGTTSIKGVEGTAFDKLSEDMVSLKRDAFESQHFATNMVTADNLNEIKKHQEDFAACCFYEQPNFKGKVMCMTAGTDGDEYHPNLHRMRDFHAHMSDHIRSVRCSKNAKVWMGNHEHHNSDHIYHVSGGKEVKHLYYWGNPETTALKVYRCKTGNCQYPLREELHSDLRGRPPRVTKWSVRQ